MAETKERNGICQAEFWANGKRIDSEEIERQYCTASRADKMRGLDIIAQAITEPVESSMPLYSARTA